MHPRRFHVPDLTAPTVHVAGREAAHALRVLRLAPGDEIILFDGQGGEALGRIIAVADDGLEVQVEQRRFVVPGDRPPLIIAAAVPKGERADWMVEKCSELGVSELRLIICDRSQVKPGPGKLDRWRRKAREAAKQSGRSIEMRVEGPESFADAVTDLCHRASTWYGSMDPKAPAWSALLPEAMHSARLLVQRSAIAVVIGPEGGLTAEEIALLERLGAKPIRLADATLRIETAALAAAAVFAAGA